jgi:hypothetical protein
LTLAQYAQIPLFADGAIPPFDQVTLFSRMNVRSMSRTRTTEAAVLYGRKPSAALQRVNTTFHSLDSGPQLSQLNVYRVSLAYITLHCCIVEKPATQGLTKIKRALGLCRREPFGQ